MGIKDIRIAAQKELEAMYTNARNMNSWRIAMLKEAYIPIAERELFNLIGEDADRLKNLEGLLIDIDAIRSSVSSEINSLRREITTRVSEASGQNQAYRQSIEDFIVSAAKAMSERYPEVLAANESSRNHYSSYRDISHAISTTRNAAEINELMNNALARFV